MATAFDRYGLFLGCTWAYRLFRRHQTELNALYWAHAPVVSDARERSKAAASSASAVEFFGFSGADAHRANWPMPVWRRAFDQFEGWVRLNAVMAASSYFELYLKAMVCLALESDPAAQLGKSRAVDGVELLKHGVQRDYWDGADKCITGSWERRLRSYEGYFGVVPTGLSSEVGRLEAIRELRNSVGHSFGRALKRYGLRSEGKSSPMYSLSVRDLQELLKLFDDLALVVDAHLGRTHIGEYETLHYYHTWKPPRKDATLRRARAFSKALNTLHNAGSNWRFAEAAIKYYEGL